MSKKILILGSTGSIGRQTLEILREFPGDFEVVGLSARENIKILLEQVQEFSPKAIVVSDVPLARKVQASVDIPLFFGDTAFEDIIEETKPDMIVNALVGFAGLSPALYAVKKQIPLLLANKESLVVAGGLIMKEARKKNVPILPLDSEHSAIFQCLQGASRTIEKILLTCSGGPFYGKTKDELKKVTVKQALSHPNWKMGKKITIDSATLMNKAFEIIEAMWLFDVNFEDIEVTIHRQSIVHSLVQFEDGNVLAQANPPDMRFPILYALFYPKSQKGAFLPRLDFSKQMWTFAPPDTDTFSAFSLAKYAMDRGGTFPTVLNTANEMAVSKFLRKKISFLEITECVQDALFSHKDTGPLSPEKILDTDRAIREKYAGK